MRTFINTLIAVVYLITVVSCQNQQDNIQTPNQEIVKKTLSGKVFRIGPSLDSLNTKAFGECDCCTSHLAFINDSLFVTIDECLHNYGYFKGNYKIVGDTVKLISDPLYILAEEDEELMLKNINKVNLVRIKSDKREFNWIKFVLNNKDCYKTNMDSLSFATPDTTSINLFIENLKEGNDSIPILLNLND